MDGQMAKEAQIATGAIRQGNAAPSSSMLDEIQKLLAIHNEQIEYAARGLNGFADCVLGAVEAPPERVSDSHDRLEPAMGQVHDILRALAYQRSLLAELQGQINRLQPLGPTGG